MLKRQLYGLIPFSRNEHTPNRIICLSNEKCGDIKSSLHFVQAVALEGVHFASETSFSLNYCHEHVFYFKINQRLWFKRHSTFLACARPWVHFQHCQTGKLWRPHGPACWVWSYCSHLPPLFLWDREMLGVITPLSSSKHFWVWPYKKQIKWMNKPSPLIMT